MSQACLTPQLYKAKQTLDDQKKGWSGGGGRGRGVDDYTNRIPELGVGVALV